MAATTSPRAKLALNRLGLSQSKIAPKPGPDEAPTASPLRAGYLGRFEALKGVHDLARAVRALPASLPIRVELRGPAVTTAERPGTVTVTGPGVHDDVHVGASGTYSVTVPAGTYTVAGHSPLYESNTELCQAARVATVTSGRSTKADVLCQMR